MAIMSRSAAAGIVSLALVASIPVQPAEAQPQLNVGIRAYRLDGTPRGGAQSPHPLITEGAVTNFFFTHRRDGNGNCTIGAADSDVRTLEDLRREYAHVWKVTRTGRTYEGGRYTFDIEWARYDSEPAGGPVVERRQRLSLFEGQAYQLDMLRSPGLDSCGVDSILLDVEAAAKEDPAVADVVLRYDLWLVHQDAAGKHTRHFVAMGRHGARVPFGFSPLRFDVPRLRPDQFNFDVVTRVGGSLRGRLAPDGKVRLELETSRTDRLEREDDALSAQNGATGGTGRKVLEAALGEAIEISLPARSGFSAQAATPASKGVSGGLSAKKEGAAPTEAFVLKGDVLAVNFKPFFEKQRVSIVLQVRKAEGADAEPLAKR
jgi:hypothetical protein